MHEAGIEPLGERCDDDGTMALVGIALEAQECYTPAERSSELIEQRILGGEVFAKLGEVALEIPVLA